MRERVVDIALIVTLVIVAAGITWTLFTLNRSDPRATSRQTLEESPRGDGGGPEVTPLPIDGEPVPREQTGGQESEPTAIGAEGSAGSEGGETGESASAESNAGPETQAQEPEETQPEARDPQPVPPGPIQLERVGFSFATGGPGACGIVLEPWTHIAVSRELLAAYGCGAEVTVTLDDETGGRTRVDAIIGDTMNPVHTRTVNIYVGEDEPALQYGVTAGMLRP